MLSINTNLSSLIAQNSMSSATKLLNQAVERMTTGYKINHSKDNAANYSISEKMNMQISSFDVAADNVAMGMDLVTTASDIISNMQDKASRLQALCTQARNGTYGAQSMQAINSEAAAIMAEINRLYNTAEYNNVSLFNRKAYEIADNLPQAGASGFINENKALDSKVVGTTVELPIAQEAFNGFINDPVTYTDAEIATMTKVADVSSFSSNTKYSITSVEELQKLATLVNSGVSTSNVIFVLGADLDLSKIDNWQPIGTVAEPFVGSFDGNGHTIKNLKINDSTLEYAGLFGYCVSSSSSICFKNLALDNVNISAKKYIGALAGYTDYDIENCYSTGIVEGSKGYVGGLVGETEDIFSFKNNYSTCDVNGRNQVGGLVGYMGRTLVQGCYATGDVNGENNVGGLLGRATDFISYSWATGDVNGVENVGGLAGYGTYVFQCYATGNVVASSRYAGGLMGYSNSSLVAENCYATGNVTGGNRVAGLTSEGNVNHCYATGKVSGDNRVGGLISVGGANYCYAKGDVTGTGSRVGGLVGEATDNIKNSYATGDVKGFYYAGGLVGEAIDNIENSYATGDVKAINNRVGGLVGSSNYGEIIDSYATGDVSGYSEVGGIIGFGKVVINSYATGDVNGESEVGGVIGSAMFNVNVSNSYTEGRVEGKKYVGGLIGYLYESDTNYSIIIDNSAAYGAVQGKDTSSTGGLIGGAALTPDGITFGTINITNNQVSSDKDVIGNTYKTGSFGTSVVTFDLAKILSGIKMINLKLTSTIIQVGINSDSSSQLEFNTNFDLDLSAIETDIASGDALNSIMDFVIFLSEKSTQLGAAENRLQSAIESIEVNIENLTSSLSTIRDADIAEVSSEYIRQQILQQASATLLSTANQSPSIALQLI